MRYLSNVVDQTTLQDKKITIVFEKMGDLLLLLLDMRTIVRTCRVFSLVYVCFSYISLFFRNGIM